MAMSPYGIRTEQPKRSGCFKVACGCFLGLVLVAAGMIVFVWWGLKAPASYPALERLPASVTAGVEVRDASTFFDAVKSDPRIVSFGMKLLQSGAFEEEGLEIGGLDARGMENAVQEFGGVVGMFVPSTLAGGLVQTAQGNERFVVVQLSRIGNWLVQSLLKSEGHAAIKNGWQLYSTRIHQSNVIVGMLDGWVLAADSEDAWLEIAEHWKKTGAVQLTAGTAMPLMRAFAKNQVSATSNSPSPFFVEEDDSASVADSASSMSELYLGVNPDQGGWRVSLSSKGWGREAVDGQTMKVPTLAGPGFAIIGKLPQERILSAVNSLWKGGDTPRADRDHPLSALSWNWLTKGWLEQMSGEVGVWTGLPVSAGGQGTPALPSILLAWRTNDMAAAQQAFTGWSSSWAESLASPGGVWPEKAIRDQIRMEPITNDWGNGAKLALPSVLANHATPAWMFPAKASGPGTAFLASDPLVLPTNPEKYELPILPGYVEMAGAWSMNKAFLDATDAIIVEKAQTQRWFGESGTRVVVGWNVIRSALESFPRGSFTGWWNDRDAGLSVEILIPKTGPLADQ